MTRKGDILSDVPPKPRLSIEDRRLIQSIGNRLRQIIQGVNVEAEDVPRRDELGILANMVNRIAKELYQTRQRDLAQRQEIEQRLEELRTAHEMQEHLLSTIRDLSSPVLNIYSGVLLLPIIGALDSDRAQHAISLLLGRIGETRARVVIIDVTGAPTIDTEVANVLIRAAQAVGLLGSRVILCGITPEIAQVVVSLGIDLGGLNPQRDLQAALMAALRMVSHRIGA